MTSHGVPSLFADEQPETEARLALALVSGFPLSRPLTLYRFGVEWSYGRFEHAERAPGAADALNFPLSQICLPPCSAETISHPPPTPRAEIADIDGDGAADEVLSIYRDGRRLRFWRPPQRSAHG